MVFYFKNCVDLMWEKNILVTKKKIWGWRSRALEQFIWTLKGTQYIQFLKQNAFLTCSWRSLRSNTLWRLPVVNLFCFFCDKKRFVRILSFGAFDPTFGVFWMKISNFGSRSDSRHWNLVSQDCSWQIPEN